MNIHALVVMRSDGERARITRLLGTATGNDTSISLRFVATFSEAMRSVGPPPDLLLLDAKIAESREPEALRTMANGFDGVPLVILATSVALSHTPLGRTLGLAAGVLMPDGTRTEAVDLLTRVVEARRRSLAQARSQIHSDIVLASMADAVVITDAAGIIRYCNPAAYNLTESGSPTAVGQSIDHLMRLQEPKTGCAIEHPVFSALREKQSVRLSIGTTLVRPDGSEIMIEDCTSPIIGSDGVLDGAVMVFHDITDAHELQSQVDYLARHDFLTGLPNRFAAKLHLHAILMQRRELIRPLAVMYLDLDNFKSINDTLGHAAGDQLLVSVATRLRACLRSIDLVSRQGGDEFLVLMALGTNDEEAADAAQRILKAVAMPHVIGGVDVHIGCSVGIALCPQHGTSEETLLQHADTALHAAKAAGKSTWCVFNDDMLTSAIRRRLLENHLRLAIAGGAFELFYQPKICLADGMVSGCEALLRWHHPEWGWVPPARFVQCAEQTGMIVPLGRWVLREALRQAKCWERESSYLGPIAVNVSALELQHPGFVDHVRESLAEFGICPSRLQIELTESALMRDVAGATVILLELKALGMSFAIDDFGTGYSSLSYLADLPVDLLKVDRAFVQGIPDGGPRRQALLRAVLAVAATLGLSAVAEGIETVAEAAFLADAGCTVGQGYYYSPALSPKDFIQFIGQAGHAAAPL